MTRISGASIGRKARPQRICLGCGSEVLPPKKECLCGSKSTVLFASRAEARRYDKLLFLQRVGEIHSLHCHPKFDLNIRDPETFRMTMARITKVGVYTADFSYEINDKKVIEDVKPFKTVKGVRKPLMSEAAAMRIRVFEALYGLKVVFVE